MQCHFLSEVVMLVSEFPVLSFLFNLILQCIQYMEIDKNTAVKPRFVD